METADVNNRTTNAGRIVPNFGCVGAVGRRFLLSMNIIFILVGVSVTTAGILLKTHETALLHDTLLKEVKAATTSSGLTGTDLSTFDLAGIIDGAAVGCISIGLVVCLIAVFGVHGIRLKNETILIAYASVIGILVVAELVFLIVVFKLRNKLSCCGVDGFNDFYKARKWSKSVRIDANTSIPLFTPVACCKSEFRAINNYACATNPTNLNSNYRQGCYDTLWDEVYKHNPLIIICATGIVLFEVLLVFFACWVAHKTIIIRKRKLCQQVPVDIQDDANFAAEGGRERSASALTANRASTTGSIVSIRRDSEGSPVNPGNTPSFIEPPPYTSSPVLSQLATPCMNFPYMQPVISAGPFTSFPFGTYGGQSQDLKNRCSCMFQGHSEYFCHRRRSSGCCTHEQTNITCCHHNNQLRDSSTWACEQNGMSCQEQRHNTGKSLLFNDQLPPPYSGNQSVDYSCSISASGSATAQTKPIDEKMSSKTVANALQNHQFELVNVPVNNDIDQNVTSGYEEAVGMDQNTVNGTRLSPPDGTSTHQDVFASSQTCAVVNDFDTSTNVTRGMQSKRALFNRRSVSGPCTKLKEYTSRPRNSFMRNRSFEDEYQS